MNAAGERNLIRTLHLVLSIPILGYIYGPVASIPQAAGFTRWIAMPLVTLTGFWLWLKPRLLRRIREYQNLRLANHSLTRDLSENQNASLSMFAEPIAVCNDDEREPTHKNSGPEAGSARKSSLSAVTSR
jgi:hypothetical protein